MLNSKLATFVAIVSVVSLLASFGSAKLHHHYESSSALYKFQSLWDKILQDPTPGSYYGSEAFTKLFAESMKPTVENFSDEFPEGRSKVIHSVGGIAKMKFVTVPDTPYTGIFKGSQYAYVRCSLAGQPAKPDSNDSAEYGFTPSCSFKFLRSGVPSANFVSMHGLSPQIGSFNFFKYPFTNHISSQNASFGETMIAQKFSTVTDWPTFVGLSDLAKYTEDGEEVDTPNFPYQLILQPTSELYFPDEKDKYFLDQLTSLRAGTVMWDIFAKDLNNSPMVMIGQFVTTSDFVTSKYIDETMFFRHQVFEEDIALRPELLDECGPTVYDCLVCPFDKDC